MNSGSNRIEAHVQVESSAQNAIELIEQSTDLSRQRIKFAMTQGAVWLTRGGYTQRLRRVKRQLQSGDELHLYYDADILAEAPPVPDLIEDVGDYSVWRKPYGLRSQGSKWGDHCTITRWAERHLQPERPAFTVHRLDRAASGLMLIAHSKKMAAALSGLFHQRAVEKHYRAIVIGDCSEWPELLRVEQPIDGKPAASEFSLTAYRADKDQSVIDVRIETGRKHQVRRHLSALGHPVVGDRLYGSEPADKIDLQLTAYRLAFVCPLRAEQAEYCLALD